MSMLIESGLEGSLVHGYSSGKQNGALGHKIFLKIPKHISLFTRVDCLLDEECWYFLHHRRYRVTRKSSESIWDHVIF